MLNQPLKPALAIWKNLQADAQTEPSMEAQYVLDGGALLHRLRWPQIPTPYRDLAFSFVTTSPRCMEHLL